MTLLIATRRALVDRFGFVAYDLRDEFSDTLAAAAVNGTPATPGPGTRAVADTGSNITISGGDAVIANGTSTWGQTVLNLDAQTRALGVILLTEQRNAATTKIFRIGFNFATGGTPSSDLFSWTVSAAIQISDAAVLTTVGTYAAATSYITAIVLRTVGAYFFVKGGAFTSWTLLWAGGLDTQATLYPLLSSYNAAANVSYMRIPTRTFIPPVCAYDTFTRANGALGSTETSGPDGQATTARAWESGGATWAIASNEAVNTPTEGADLVVNGAFAADSDWTKGAGWSIAAGVATHAGAGGAGDLTASVAPLTAATWYKLTYDIANRTAGTLTAKTGTVSGPARSTNDSFIETNRASTTALAFTATDPFDGDLDNVVAKALTLNTLFSDVDDSATSNYLAEVELDTVVAGTQAGMILNLDDASTPANFVIAYHDGTNAHLDKCVAGTYTSVISAAATYAAGAKIVAIKDGTSYSLYYNKAQVGTTQTISDAGVISNTKHGLFSTYSGNQLDNFAVFYRTHADYDREFDAV